MAPGVAINTNTMLVLFVLGKSEIVNASTKEWVRIRNLHILFFNGSCLFKKIPTYLNLSRIWTVVPFSFPLLTAAAAPLKSWTLLVKFVTIQYFAIFFHIIFIYFKYFCYLLLQWRMGNGLWWWLCYERGQCCMSTTRLCQIDRILVVCSRFG